MGFLIIVSEQQSLKSPQCENSMGTAPQRYRKTLYYFAVTHVCCAVIHCNELREQEICVGDTVF